DLLHSNQVPPCLLEYHTCAGNRERTAKAGQITENEVQRGAHRGERGAATSNASAASGKEGQHARKRRGEFGEGVSRAAKGVGGWLGGGVLRAADRRECAAIEGRDARSVREKRANRAGPKRRADDGQFGPGGGGDPTRFGAHAGLPAGGGKREQTDSRTLQHDQCVVAIRTGGPLRRPDDVKRRQRRQLSVTVALDDHAGESTR